MPGPFIPGGVIGNAIGNAITIGNANAFDLNQAQEYIGYRQITDYEYDPGVFVLPIASREAKTIAARVHGGVGYRKVNVAASKRGGPPILPAAADTDRDVLVGCTINLPLPSFHGDSPNYTWTAGGSYTYVTAGKPRIPGRDMLPAGQYPFPLPLQDAVASETAKGHDSIVSIAQALAGKIATGSYVWPFTVMPPQFFNSLLLRDSDVG